MKTMKSLFGALTIMVCTMQPLASQTKNTTNSACAGIKVISVIKNNIVYTGDQVEIDFYFTTTDATIQYSIALPFEDVTMNDTVNQNQNITFTDKSMGTIETINSKKYLVISSFNKDNIYFKNVEGKCSFKMACGNSGQQILEGYLISNHKDRCLLPFKQEYYVQTPRSVVAADKMNVIYAGLPNPISIAIPGIADELVQATCTGGTLTKTDIGKWDVITTPEAKEITIQVAANINGVNRSFGQTKFRIKAIPNPTVFIIGLQNGKTEISKTTLCKVAEVRAVLKDFIFDGISYAVIGFTVAGGNPYFEAKCEGTKFSEESKKLIKESTNGSKITIYNIRVRGVDGSARTLTDSITLTLTE